MELLAILAFLAIIIVAGGCIAFAFVYVPRLIVLVGGSDRMPGWLSILFSYILSLVALKLFGRFLPGGLSLMSFIFLMTTFYHLCWLLKEVSAAARAAIGSGVLFLVVGLVLNASQSGLFWPLSLAVRFARFFS